MNIKSNKTFAICIIAMCAINFMAIKLCISYQRNPNEELKDAITHIKDNCSSVLVNDSNYYENVVVDCLLTPEFKITRKNYINNIKKLKSEPFSQNVRIEDIWTGAIWEGGEVRPQARTSINDIQIFSDSLAHIIISYEWEDNPSENIMYEGDDNMPKSIIRTYVMKYNADKKWWFVDDLITNGGSQKNIDTKLCQELEDKIDEYYKNWRFEWQHKTVRLTGGNSINMYMNGAWEKVYGGPFYVKEENENFYKTDAGYIRKSEPSISVKEESSFIINEPNKNSLRVVLQFPDSAYIRINSEDWYRGTFITKGAKLFVDCHQHDKMVRIKGRFEDINSISLDNESLKNIGWNGYNVAVNPLSIKPKPSENKQKKTKSPSIQRRESNPNTTPCTYCMGTGKMAQRGGGMVLGYTNCPYCGGTGNVYHPY